MRRIVFALLLFSLPALAQDVWLNYSFAHRPVPKWQNGFLLAYQTYKEPSAIFAFDRSGQMILNKRIDIPGLGEIHIHDTAASLDGRFAIAAGTATGAFIASLTPSGAMAWIVKSTDFAAERTKTFLTLQPGCMQGPRCPASARVENAKKSLQKV